jgi:hypothetical protein
MSKLIYVASSNGELGVNPSTGGVIYCHLDTGGDECIELITAFDLAEYKKHYSIVLDAHLPECIDILDLGYWLKDGSYEPPAGDWRNLTKFPQSDHSPYLGRNQLK